MGKKKILEEIPTVEEIAKIVDALPPLAELATDIRKIIAYKLTNDAQRYFCGEAVQVDEDGREFFEIAAYLRPLAEQHMNLKVSE